MPIQSILLATDGSRRAELALPVVAGLVDRANAGVTFVHAEVGGSVGHAFEHEQRLLRGHLAALAQVAARLGLRSTFRVVSGAPEQALVDAAERGDYDLLVVVHDGRTGDRDSVAAELAARSEVPVLVCHAPVDAAAAPAITPRPLREVLIAVDPDDDGNHALRAAVALAHSVGAKARVGAILRERGLEPGVAGVGPLMPQLPMHRLADAEAAKLRLAARISAVGARSVGVHVAAFDDVAAGLVALALDEQADLIVAAPYGKGPVARLLLGSVTRRLVALSPLPVLIIGEAASARLLRASA